MNQCADENYVWAVQWIPNLSFAHLVSADDLVQNRLDETRSAEQSVPILQQWLDGQTGDDSEPPRAKRRRGPSWQKVAMTLLWKPSLVESLVHLRKRLDKLGCNNALRCSEGYRGQKALAVLARLKTLVSPRVQASYLRTLCNGWSTRTRFQESGFVKANLLDWLVNHHCCVQMCSIGW